MKELEGDIFSSGMLMPGAVCHTPTNSSECGYGNGFSSTPSRTLKTTVFAPTPAARVISVITVNIGARPSLRNTCRNWSLNSIIGATFWHSRYSRGQRFPSRSHATGTFADRLSSEKISTAVQFVPLETNGSSLTEANSYTNIDVCL